MTAKCIIEGFRPAILARAETPLKWQPRAVGAKALAHLADKASRSEAAEKIAHVHQSASDFLNILDIYAQGADSEIYLAENEPHDSLYFAIKVFKNTCGFASIKVPENESLVRFARNYAESALPCEAPQSIVERRLF